MDWNDPDNFEFPFQVWCNQVRRVRSLYLSYFIGQNKYYQFPTSDAWYWGSGYPFAPAHSVLSWYPDHWEINPQVPEPVPGPVYQTVPGGYWFALNLPNTVSGYVTNLIQDLVMKKVVPLGTTWQEISQAIREQTIGLDPYGLPQPIYPPIVNWRSGFVEEINRRKKLMWETLPLLNPLDKYYLVYGRIPPVPNSSAIGISYFDRVVWIEPLAETYKVYKLRCGRQNCCCCCC